MQPLNQRRIRMPKMNTSTIRLSWIYHPLLRIYTNKLQKGNLLYTNLKTIITPKFQHQKDKMTRKFNCSITNQNHSNNDYKNTKFTLILWRIPPVATGYLFSILALSLSLSLSLKHKNQNEILSRGFIFLQSINNFTSSNLVDVPKSPEWFHTDLSPSLSLSISNLFLQVFQVRDKSPSLRKGIQGSFTLWRFYQEHQSDLYPSTSIYCLKWSLTISNLQQTRPGKSLLRPIAQGPAIVFIVFESPVKSRTG